MKWPLISSRYEVAVMKWPLRSGIFPDTKCGGIVLACTLNRNNN